jgi:amidohydrolase
VLRNGTSAAAVGLRADLDALHIHEKSGVAYASTQRRQDACMRPRRPHDDAARRRAAMAQRRNFDGTAYFIFQPAEENEGGGRVMVQEGLFDRFPMTAVYGMHNWPELPVGKIALREGPLMGAYDIFEIVATGRGAHAAMPHLGRDPMPYAAHVINALQTIVARNIHPLEAGVVSVTQVHGGDTWNVIPQEVVLRGTVRTFVPEVQDLIERRMARSSPALPRRST